MVFGPRPSAVPLVRVGYGLLEKGSFFAIGVFWVRVEGYKGYFCWSAGQISSSVRKKLPNGPETLTTTSSDALISHLAWIKRCCISLCTVCKRMFFGFAELANGKTEDPVCESTHW